MKSHTKDEKYLILLYDLASATGDPFAECDMYSVGAPLGLHERTVDNIVKLLAQTNFIRKRSGTLIALTPHGEALVRTLKSDIR